MLHGMYSWRVMLGTIFFFFWSFFYPPKIDLTFKVIIESKSNINPLQSQ
jgi:hypothetical protein